MFLEHVENNKKIKCIKTKQPKFSNHRGRTWDEVTIVLHYNEKSEKVSLYYDSTWGTYGYFFFQNQWYKINLIENNFEIIDSYFPEYIVKNKNDK